MFLVRELRVRPYLYSIIAMRQHRRKIQEYKEHASRLSSRRDVFSDFITASTAAWTSSTWGAIVEIVMIVWDSAQGE